MIAIKKGDIVRFKEASVFCNKHPHIYECVSDEWTVGRHTLIKLSGFRGGVRTDQLEIVNTTSLCCIKIINAITTLKDFCAKTECGLCPIEDCSHLPCSWEIKEEFERKFADE